jgi:hypothetical protein
MYVGQRYCTKCKEQTTHHDLSCQVCAADARKEAQQKRRMDLAGLKGLTVEERLERIEAQLYDLAPRVGALESKTATY